MLRAERDTGIVLNILASNPDAIGDFVLRQPMYDAILKAGHRLTLIVREHVAPLASLVAPASQVLVLQDNPYSETFDLTCPRIQSLLWRARELRPDRVLVAPYQWTQFDEALAVYLPSTPMLRMTGVRFPPGSTELGFSETAHTLVQVPEEAPELTKTELLYSALAGCPVSFPRPELVATERGLTEARALLSSLIPGESRFLYACVGRVDPSKARNWKPEGWATFLTWAAQHYDVDIVFGGTPEEHENTANVRRLMGSAAARTFDTTSSGAGLEALLGLLTISQGYVGHDTGPMHLAAALGKPVIAVFSGGHWPRFVPNAVAGVVLTVDVPCRGCRLRCHLPEPYCISLLSPETVVAATRDLTLNEKDGLVVRSIALSEAATPDTPLHLIETSPSDSMRDQAVVTSDNEVSLQHELPLAATLVDAATAAAVRAELEAVVAALQERAESLESELCAATKSYGEQETAHVERIRVLESVLEEAHSELAKRDETFAALQLEKIAEERRAVELGNKLVRMTVECQSLRSRGELQRYRSEVQLAEKEGQLALASEQIRSLHDRLREVLAELKYIESKADEPKPVEALPQIPHAELERMTLRLREVEEERIRLQNDLDNSLALRLARSMGWILSPLRRTIAGAKPGTGQ